MITPTWKDLLTIPQELQQLYTSYQNPWEIIENLENYLRSIIPDSSGIFIHPEAKVENGANIKAPAYICKGALISWTCLLREGVFVGVDSIIGPGCEVKNSVIGDQTTLAHFNYVGNSIIGTEVNLAAGVVVANYKNEFANKDIYWEYQGQSVLVPLQKFGAVIGNEVKIGSNSVVSPGKVLLRNQTFGALKYIV